MKGVLARWLGMGLSFALLLPLAGCNGSGNTSTGSATVSFAVADTPVDGAKSVDVTFTGLQIQGSSGPATEYKFSSPKQIDLLKQQNGNSANLLNGVKLPAGHYQWIRLLVDLSKSSITLSDGSVHSLNIPSGIQTGLKLVSGFTVAAGDVTDFTIDFDLRQAVTCPSGQTACILKPALRLINNVQIGKIAGSVSNTFTVNATPISSAGCMPAVYVYSGSGTTPADINPTSSVQPVATGTLSLNSGTGDYDYSVGFLAAGDYTLAVTCAGKDDPATVDTLPFSATKNATVTARQTTTVNFP